MNLVRGVADLLHKSPNPAAEPTPGSPSVRGGCFPGADLEDAPAPLFVFSDSTEEGALNTLWLKYENAHEQDEKEKSLHIFVLKFLQTFRDWGPRHTDQLVDQELGSDEVVVGCSYGHPSEVILILIQEISLITSIITESGTSPESSPKHLEQLEPLELSTERLHVLECLTILTRSVHNCRVFSYYGGVQKVTSLLKAAVDQLKTLNSLHAVDDQSSGQAVANTRIILKILICIITIISNFMKLEPTVTRDPHFADTTKYVPSNSYLATSAPENSIPDALLHWQQKAIVLVLEAGCVNRLVGKVAFSCLLKLIP
uniref:Uncharacterized protein n=1 Tax=Avena sativa TaxID=4498 RepID=A0ACD6ACN4_AVESA